MPCEELIQFDVEAVTSNLSNRYTMLQYVSAQNYESLKQQYAASFPEYFSGSYDQFKQQRNELTKLFIAAGYTDIQTSTYRRTLSATSAAAYAACLAQNSNKLISGWVEAYNDNKIFVTIRNGRREDVSYTVIGGKPLDGGDKLVGGGTQTLAFDYDPGQHFLVAFNAIGDSSKEMGSTIVELERERHFEIRTTQKELSATFTCGAGGYNSNERNRISTDAVFVADQDYYLLYDTRKVVRTEVIGGPGLQSYEMDWIRDPDTGARPRRVVAHPYNMVGNDDDEQGIIQVTCSIVAERQYLVEIVPEKPAAAPALAVAA